MVWVWRRSRIRRRISRFWLGSSPAVGSSRISSEGSPSSASARPTRWRNPLERWPMIRPRTSSSAQRSLTRSTSRRRAAPRLRPRSRARKSRYSPTRISRYRGAPSGRYPRLRRTSRQLLCTSIPSTSTAPLVGGRNPVRILMQVVFPAPLGPSRPSTSPRSTLEAQIIECGVPGKDLGDPLDLDHRAGALPVASGAALLAAPGAVCLDGPALALPGETGTESPFAGREGAAGGGAASMALRLSSICAPLLGVGGPGQQGLQRPDALGQRLHAPGR